MLSREGDVGAWVLLCRPKFCIVYIYDVGYYMYTLVYNYKYTVNSYVHKW